MDLPIPGWDLVKIIKSYHYGPFLTNYLHPNIELIY